MQQKISRENLMIRNHIMVIRVASKKIITGFLFMFWCGCLLSIPLGCKAVSPPKSVAVNAFKTPCITIPKAKSTITIDGVIGKEEWQNAAEIGGFIGLNSKQETFVPTEKTTLLLKYDENNIYFAFRMVDQALKKINMMEDKFSQIHVGDHHSQRDESISIWFAPPSNNNQPAKQYWFAINANNLLIGRGDTMDYSDNDKHVLKRWQNINGHSWGSNWQDPKIFRKAIKYDGYWIMEIAIPFAEFDLQPGNTAPWHFNFVRNNIRLDQWSLWIPNDNNIVKNYMTPAFRLANANQWGLIKFGDNSPVINTSCNLAEKEKSTKKIDITISAGTAQKLSLNIKYQTENSNDSLVIKKELDIKNKVNVFKTPFPGCASKLQYNIATQQGEIIFCSPINNLSSRGGVDILAHNTETFSLFLNGKRFDTKKGLNSLQDFLTPGINVVAVKLPKGSSFSAILSNGKDKIATDSTWHVSNSVGEGWTKYGYDDSAWKSAEATLVENSIIAGAKVISNKTDGDIFLRKVILDQFTNLYPDLLGTKFHLTKNGTYFLAWNGTGHGTLEKDTYFKDIRLILEIPDTLQLIDVAASEPTPFSAAAEDADKPKFNISIAYKMTLKKELLRNGKLFKRYEIRFPVRKKLTRKLATSFVSSRGVVIALKAIGDVSENVSVYYSTKAFGDNYQEFPQELKCAILPELNVKPPKSLTTYKAGFELLALKNEKILKERLDTLKKSGINTVFTYSTSPLYKKMGMKQVWFTNLFCDGYGAHGYHSLSAVDISELIKNKPEAQSVMSNGEKGVTPCPAYIVEHPETWKYIDAKMQDIKQRNPSLTELFWDFEFPMGGKSYSCFSKFGIELFAEKHNITGLLTPKIILDKYKDKWILFWWDCNARLAGVMKKYANKSGLKFTMWSGYPGAYPRDVRFWKHFSPNTDMVYCGYSDSSAIILETRKLVNNSGKLLNGGVLLDDIRFPPTIAQILKVGMYAGGGIHMWLAIPADARLNVNCSSAFRFFSDYELFLKLATLCPVDKFAEVKGIAKENIIAYRLKDQVLIAFTNTTTRELKVKVKLKTQCKNITEYFSGQKYLVQNLQLKILPGQARILDVYLLNDH